MSMAAGQYVSVHGRLRCGRSLKALSETRWMGLRLGRSGPASWGLNLLERRLVESHTTAIVPFDDRVIFVSLFNRTQLSSRLSEVAQTLDAISGNQFVVASSGLGERWPLGTV